MSKQDNILILGCSGQDGSNMADYLLRNTEYQIYGGVRRLSVPNYNNINHLLSNPRFKLISVDLSDSISIDKAVESIVPKYLINFAANSFVASSWTMPLQVMDININGVIRCLEAIKKYVPNCRFYSAGSSEEFGDVQYSPQNIHTEPRPRSIYGVSKVAARFATKVYRESYGLYAVHGILFNHEGPRRGHEFVTRKITMGVAQIKKAIEAGLSFKSIELGNIDAKRDWSDSEDFCDGIWRMINQEKYSKNLSEGIDMESHLYYNRGKKVLNHKIAIPQCNLHKYIKNYVLASGEMHSIREFCELAFQQAGIQGTWRKVGKGPFKPEDEVYLMNNSNNIAIVEPDDKNILLRINPKFYRPADVEELCGDSTPIREDLGWQPKTSFEGLVKKMVEHDINLLK